MKYSKTIEGRVAARIARKKDKVVVRDDFRDLGGYDQIGRALLALTQKGKLVRIGYGLYAKTRISTVTGKVIPAGDLPALASEALNKLGIETVPTKADQEYAQGRTTQVPTGRLIGVNKRVYRKIGFEGGNINYAYAR